MRKGDIGNALEDIISEYNSLKKFHLYLMINNDKCSPRILRYKHFLVKTYIS